MKHLIVVVVFMLTGCATTSSSVAPASADGAVRNIILMIADGSSAGLWTAVAYAKEGALSIERMPVVGLVDTRSASAKVTDSAAGASVYATGERTPNRTIAVGGNCPLASSRDTIATTWPAGCERLETWFEVARAKGRDIGLVTTTYITDATPASFIAHSPSRYWRQYIAEQIAEVKPEVMLGGGRSYFDARSDGRDLLRDMCASADCVWTASDLASYRPGDRPLIGLFAPADMDDVEPRTVALPAMVDAALQRLARSPRGFVAMFETEATDNSTHANAPLDVVTGYMLEFDRAVEVALEFAARTPGTLVIVTSDHETGGFALAERGTDFELGYTTRGHTAVAVPLFAFGPEAERFAGWRQNYEIGRTLMQIVRDWD